MKCKCGQEMFSLINDEHVEVYVCELCEKVAILNIEVYECVEFFEKIKEVE